MAMGPGVDQRRQHAAVVAAAVGVVLFLALPFAVATAVYPTLADGPDLLGARFEAAQHVRVAGLAGGLCLVALLMGWARSARALALRQAPRAVQDAPPDAEGPPRSSQHPSGDVRDAPREGAG